MKLRLVRPAVLFALAILVIAGLSACGGGDSSSGGETSAAAGGGAGEPLKLGAALALTGEAAFADVPNRAGIEYAVEQINAEGGVDGHPIELQVKDMKSDPKLSGAVAEELLDSGAAVLIGPPFPDNNIGVMQAADSAGVATVLPLETDPVNAEVAPGTVIFTAFADTQQAAAAAEFAIGQGEKTVVTVTSPDGSYTENTPKYFAEIFEAEGGEVIGDVQYSIGQTEFDSVASKVADLNPDAIYTAMFPPDTPIFLQALKRAGWSGNVYGPDGFDSPTLVSVAGAAAENVFFTANGFPAPGTPHAKLVDGIEAATGEKPESAAFAGLGYDSVQLIKAAVEAAGSIEPAAILEGFEEVDTLKGVTGEITLLGDNQFPVKPVTVVQIEDGKFELAEQITPKNVPEPLSR